MFFDDRLRLLERYYRLAYAGESVPHEHRQVLTDIFDHIADRIVQAIAPASVLDVGCAYGLLVDSLRRQGVRAFGVCFSERVFASLDETVKPYCWHEIGAAFGHQNYDLIISLETLGRISRDNVEHIIRQCCQPGNDDVLFSAIPFDGDDLAFPNMQPPEYWASLFSRYDFYRDVDFDASFITPWAIRFRRYSGSHHPLIAAYERKFWMLWQETQARRELNVELESLVARKNYELESLESLVARKNYEIEKYSLQVEQGKAKNKALQGEITSLRNSRSWRLIRHFQRFREKIIPPGSRRENWFYAILRAGRVFHRDGVHGIYSRLSDRAAWRWKVFWAGWRYRVQSSDTERVIQIPAVAERPPVRYHHGQAEIVICVHNALDDVRRCLDSLIQYTTFPYALILVDDGSDAETRDFLARFSDKQGCDLLRNEQASGYTRAANQGLRHTSADYVVLLNSDTIVSPGWLVRMVTCLESDEKIGLVGPLSNTASWQSIPEVEIDGDWAENPLPEGVTVEQMGEFVARSSARLYPEMPFLNGFCLMLRREVIEEIGYFDEESFPEGYGEENDYCLRARQAGWKLVLADDTYIYHAQSRSYSHERRRKLSQRASGILAKKYGQRVIDQGVSYLRGNRVLEGIRARARHLFERQEILQAGQTEYAGRKLLFILPVRSPGGGSNIVMMEAHAMRKMGVDVQILNLRAHRASFDEAYDGIDLPILYVEIDEIPRVTARYDAVVATFNPSVAWLRPALDIRPDLIVGYYVQDFEPLFYPPDGDGYRTAWDSYTLIPDTIRFAKTEWTCQQIETQIGVSCHLVGPSMDVDLFRPRPRNLEWPDRPLQIGAMIRPSSLYRAPWQTMEILGRLKRKYGSRVDIVLFGTEATNPRFNELPNNFPWKLAGILTPRQVANYLNDLDIFVDFSSHQAMGLTAMEAMACGTAVILPQAGGTSAFAVHEKNCLMADTADIESCWQQLTRLVDDHHLRERLQLTGLRDMPQYFPERPALNILKLLFGE